MVAKRATAADGFAFDRASVRHLDEDGRLHVAITNISKSNICPYLGREIPGFERLGLEADRVYHLLRDPDEMAKAASTFNNLPLLSRHVPVTAADHQPHLVVGSTGTDASFNAPYLQCSLVVWDDAAIAGIETGQQRELSSAYRYDADMTPGEYQGAAYDGVMRNLRGNHVALVETGRAGADVVVGDSLKELSMKLNSRKALGAACALTAYLAPKMAQDAALPDLEAILKGVTAKNWAASKPKIATALGVATKGHLAQDADLEDVVQLLDRLDDVTDEAAMDEEAETDEEKAARMKARADKAANDESPDDDKDKPVPVTKAAMDAAITLASTKAAGDAEAATVARMNGIRAAERDVRPYVGEIAVAMDSAAAVYKFALDHLKVEVGDDVHPSAYPHILKAQPVPGAASPRKHLAMDAAGAKGLETRIPGINRLKSA